ncbi:hypothetical protein [Candidatus Hepatobacter penaei]|uniref:hypothetical protein n=1 Tax=Candidatus Hepatobacter penaei TaxID=1274402 RepID=UPI0004F301C3|nr:hypothetical protein [Candidatus Hepatobacter penaei]
MKRSLLLTTTLFCTLGVCASSLYAARNGTTEACQDQIRAKATQAEEAAPVNASVDEGALSSFMRENAVLECFPIDAQTDIEAEPGILREKVLRVATVVTFGANAAHIGFEDMEPSEYGERRAQIDRFVGMIGKVRPLVYDYHRLSEGHVTKALLKAAFPGANVDDLVKEDYAVPTVIMPGHRAWFEPFLEKNFKRAAANYAEHVMSVHPDLVSVYHEMIQMQTSMDEREAMGKEYRGMAGFIQAFYDRFDRNQEIKEQAEQVIPGIFEMCKASYSLLDAFNEQNIEKSFHNFMEKHEQILAAAKKEVDAEEVFEASRERRESIMERFEGEIEERTEAFSEAMQESKGENRESFNTVISNGGLPAKAEQAAQDLVNSFKTYKKDMEPSPLSVTPSMVSLAKMEDCAKKLMHINKELDLKIEVHDLDEEGAYLDEEDAYIFDSYRRTEPSEKEARRKEIIPYQAWLAFVRQDMKLFQYQPKKQQTEETGDGSGVTSWVPNGPLSWKGLEKQQAFSPESVAHIAKLIEPFFQNVNKTFSEIGKELTKRENGRSFLTWIKDPEVKALLSASAAEVPPKEALPEADDEDKAGPAENSNAQPPEGESDSENVRRDPAAEPGRLQTVEEGVEPSPTPVNDETESEKEESY